ncbi:MAG: cytochrome b/b6 domain-containing protein [Janthinobacterium lividum]
MPQIETKTNAGARRYSSIALFFHWTIAILILLNLLLGWRMGLMHGLTKFQIFQVHKSFGVTVLLLSVARLAWRLAHRPPPLPRGLHPVEVFAAHATHWVFYGFMILMPLSGWILVSSSAENIPTLLYRFIPWPYFPGIHGLPLPRRHEVGALADGTHYWLAWSAVALIVLHVGGALKHQFDRGTPVLPRMLPGPKSAETNPSRRIAFLAAVAAGCGAVVLVLVGYSSPTPVVSRPVMVPAQQAASNWVIDKAASTLGFETVVNGQPVVGHFSQWSAVIDFDPQHLADAKVEVLVDTGSATTQDDTRDQMLPTPDWFDRAVFPQARFHASRILSLGGNNYEADGNLKIRSADKPVVLPFTLDIVDGKATMSASMPLDRTAFSVGQGQWAGTDSVAATVTVKVALVAHARNVEQTTP